MARAFALALACAAALAVGAAAQDGLPPKGAIATATWFPKLGATAEAALPAGEAVTVVIGARNEGKEAYTLNAVVGGVHTKDWAHRIQNFTRSLVGDELLPGQETSLEYSFYVDPILAGREFGVAVALTYSSAASPSLASVAFNQTVDVTEPPRLVDTEAIFMFLVLAALGLGAAYLAYGVAAERLGLPTAAALLGKAGAAGGVGGAGGGGAGGGGAARKAAPKKAADDDEWVKGTSYDLAKRKRATVAARVKATAE